VSEIVKTVTLVGNTVCIDEADFDCLIEAANYGKKAEKQLKTQDARISELKESLIDAACDLSSCPNMEFKGYMEIAKANKDEAYE